MGADLLIRMSGIRDLNELSALALRSKAHWGYSEDFLAACREELRVAPEQQARTWLGELHGKIVAFYSYSAVGVRREELELFFVDPPYIGRGIGRALFEHFVAGARQRGVEVAEVQSDPGAESFYRRMGARVVGRRPSQSVPGRALPVLQFDL